MALSSAFRERLEQMEHTRNQRLSLLQEEKELQANRSQILASKLTYIRSVEQRCLVLERNIVCQSLKILTLKSEIDSLNVKYLADLQQLRVLKSEVEELEELEKEKERFYEMKGIEMEEFKENVGKFVVRLRMEVNELRNRLNELRLTFTNLQGNNGFLGNSEIAAAEMKRLELLTVKDNLDKSLVSNYQIRAQLQKELQNILITRNQDRSKLFQFTENKGILK